MRFIYSVLFVLSTVVAKALRVVYALTILAASAVTITLFVVAYSTAVMVHAKLSPDFGMSATFIAAGAAFGVCIASVVAAGFVIAIARVFSETSANLASSLEVSMTDAFAPKPKHEVVDEPQLELSVAPVKRAPNRRVEKAAAPQATA